MKRHCTLARRGVAYKDFRLWNKQTSIHDELAYGQGSIFNVHHIFCYKYLNPLTLHRQQHSLSLFPVYTVHRWISEQLLSFSLVVSLTPTRKGQLHLSGKNYEYLQRDQRTSTQWYWRIFKYFIGANHPLQNRRLLLWRLLICWRAKQEEERSAVRALFILSAEQKAQNDMQTPFT